MNSLFKKFTGISPSGYQYKTKKSTHPFWMEEGGETMDYNELENKPSINGVTLQGNKTSGQLSMYTKAEVDALIEAIPTGTDNYEDLSNLPKIAGVTLKGNKSLGDLGILTQAQIESLVNAKLDKDKGVFYDENKLKYYYHPSGFPEGYYRTENVPLTNCVTDITCSVTNLSYTASPQEYMEANAITSCILAFIPCTAVELKVINNVASWFSFPGSHTALQILATTLETVYDSENVQTGYNIVAKIYNSDSSATQPGGIEYSYTVETMTVTKLND